MGFLVVGVGFVAAALLLLVLSGRPQRARAPRRRLADARDGMVLQVGGVIRNAGTPLIAPLSERACCGYAITVQRQAADGWERVLDVTCVRPFVLDDGSGRAFVHGEHVLIEGLGHSVKLHDERTPPILLELAARSSVQLQPGMIASEIVIAPGDRIRVEGELRREVSAEPGAGYRTSSERLVLADVTDGNPLFIWSVRRADKRF